MSMMTLVPMMSVISMVSMMSLSVMHTISVNGIKTGLENFISVIVLYIWVKSAETRSSIAWRWCIIGRFGGFVRRGCAIGSAGCTVRAAGGTVWGFGCSIGITRRVVRGFGCPVGITRWVIRRFGSVIGRFGSVVWRFGCTVWINTWRTWNTIGVTGCGITWRRSIIRSLTIIWFWSIIRIWGC